MKIAFFRGWKYGDWRNRFIAIYTMGPYSHAELVFSDGMWFSSSPNENGVRYKPSLPGSIDYQWVFLNLPVNAEDEAKLRAWCDGEVGCGYDWREVFRFAFPWFSCDDSRWFCSEICLAGLHELGLLTQYKQEDYSPNALYKLLIDSGLKIVV